MLIALAILSIVLLGMILRQNVLVKENRGLITRERVFSATQERRQRRYEQTLRVLVDAVIVIGRDGLVEYINEQAQSLTGWTEDEAVGQPYDQVYAIVTESGVHEDVQTNDSIGETLRTGVAPEKRSILNLQTKDGRQVKITEKVYPLHDDQNRVEGVLCFFRDMSRKEVQRAQIEELTFRDSLTGLYNRAYFEEELPRIDIPENLPLSIMVGDLDGLKLTNDIFGHVAGDELLKMAGKALAGMCRPDDLVFRWGGDEFVVLLPRTSSEEVARIRDAFMTKLSGKSIGPVQAHMPLGCATKERVEQDIQVIWQQADEQMYWMKTVGRSAFQQQTLERICQELFSRSAGEKDHAEHVSALAEEFGMFLGLSEADLRKLRMAGYLHDIGKVALDPEILHKPYPLDLRDQHEMKRHPLVGFRLLNFFEETADLADGVLAHHEKWDGTGYPKGLQGNEIPLLGRILAIVETYDRVLFYPFTQSFSPEEALQLIADGAGNKFDPHLAKSFLEMIKLKDGVEVAISKEEDLKGAQSC